MKIVLDSSTLMKRYVEEVDSWQSDILVSSDSRQISAAQWVGLTTKQI